MIKKSILVSLVSSSILFGSNLEKSNDNTIIIYNDLALVNNKGKIKVDGNVSDLQIPNISSNLITDSVSINFDDKNLSILEQNYKYDIINFDSILNFNLNKEVQFKTENAILLSNNNGCVIKHKLNEKISNVNCNELSLYDMPNDMISVPSLYWKLYNKNKNESNTNFDLSYLSNGFDWNSNYVANIQDKSIYLNGWVNLTNNSDSNLNDYKLILLAGKPNIVKENVRHMQENMVMSKSMMMDSAAGMEVKEESFAGYHTYKIPFKVDIPKKSTKQISFINKKIDNSNIEYKVDLNYYNNQDKIKFNKFVSFDNKEENGLGIPLPSGKIRFYQKDNENVNYFLGEDKVVDTPIKETLSLKIGQDFDSTLNIKLLEQVHNNNIQLNKVEYTIKNPSKEDKTYIIKQFNPIYNLKKKDIDIDSTCKDICNLKFEDTRYLIYTIKLKKDSEYSFISTLKND